MFNAYMFICYLGIGSIALNHILNQSVLDLMFIV